jgi:predicted PurR-regulated permease PerM
MLPRGVVLLVGAAAATIAVTGVRATADIVAPIFLALVLTVLVHPLRGRLARAHVPGWAASMVCVAIVYSIFVGLTVSLAISAARFAQLLPGYQDQLGQTVKDVTTWLDSLGVPVERLGSALDSLDLSRLTSLVSGLLGGLWGILSNLIFMGTVVLFLTFDASAFSRHLERLSQQRPALATALTTWASGTRTYLLVSTVFGLIVAVLDTAALALLGVPVPLLWGLLSFITNYIPNIGFVIGLVPPAILGLLEGGPGQFLQVIAVYSVINLVIQSVIQPKFVGDAVGLSTTLTFVSLVFWAWILGPLGALLAIPLSLFVKALLVDADPAASWVQPLLSNRAEPQSGIVTTSTTITPTELR